MRIKYLKTLRISLCFLFFTNVLLATVEVPEWWGEYNVLSGVAQDDAIALQGQAKFIAVKACEVIEDHYRYIGGAGDELTTMVESFTTTHNNEVLLIGQLKYIASKFYDRFDELGIEVYDITLGGKYPWTDSTSDDADNSPALLGQLKYVFSNKLIVDMDNDGLLDLWETHYFGDLSQAGFDDSDNDGTNNIDEFSAVTNPTVFDLLDTDNDGLHDPWETYYFGNLNQIESDDFDGDGVSNIEEYHVGTNPIVFDLLDTDNDGLHDPWELHYFGSLDQDASDDFDKDGVSNVGEYNAKRDPTVFDLLDTDNDGLHDLWEIYYFSDLSQTGSNDSDHDGRSNIEEYSAGTNPAVFNILDTDNDGLHDPWEIYYFNDLSQTGSDDPDHDGRSNSDEYNFGSDPVYNPSDSVFDGYRCKAAGSFDETGGVSQDQNGQFGVISKGIYRGFHSVKSEDWVLYKNLNFQRGLERLRVFVITGPELEEHGHHELEIREGSLSGELLGKLIFDSSGETHMIRSVDLESLSGLHDIYMIFSEGMKPFSIDWFQFDPLKDTDEDRLPDSWETDSFGDLSQSGWTDYDGDGISNYDEYVVGSDPTLN